ncbi:MAG: organic solvent tolerance protein precursor-like protein [Ramlibacter sp.]|nr:organic solvent tolerance protein precursor-like protein [Ramlibacter sp.]
MHHLRTKASHPRFALSPVALVVVSLLHAPFAVAQPDSEPSPRLKPSAQLREDIPAAVRSELPTFVEGDRISGRTEIETTIEGDAELRRGDTVIRADRLQYTQPDDLARATGNVHINKAGNIFEGPFLELRIDAFQGFFNEPRYRFLRNNAYGEADRIDFIDDNHAVIRNATYTTCQRRPGPGWMPDWILRAASISIDQEEETGQARNAVLSFLGFPILPVPALSFPLGDKRKSGLLPPTFGIDSVSGFELTLPYYWNIAPNRDATIYPTLMTKRGIDLGAEFRYLEPGYSGLVRGNYLPNDRLRDRDRWGFHLEHAQPSIALPAIGPVGLNLNLNRVSDDDYWRDFSRNSASLTQRLLSNDGTLNWGKSSPIGDFSVMGRMLKWQTLKDPTAPIIPPYDRAPQLNARYSKLDLPFGLDTTVETDYTRFESDPFLTAQPNAKRAYLLAQLSRTWQTPGWFITPRVQVQTRHYDFDSPLANGRTAADVTVPTVSLDTGVVLERDTSIFGRRFLQTLEPRAFYVNTPFRDQNFLPNYDTGYNDFNFATIYTENSFGGQDRIADNNLLTLGATTRLIDPDTGAEAARFALAQRLRFKDQLVTLPGGAPVSERLSDVLFGASVNLVAKWSVDTTLQYNPKTSQSIRQIFGVRYSPANYRVVSAAYRRQQGVSEQIDIGWQWPLNDLWGDKGQNLGPGMGEGEGRWYSVGRLNVDLRDRRVVEGVLGLEYDAGCYLARVVVERMQAGTNSSNKRILFQLEFVGFSNLGSNALQSLKQNIPRYQYLRERSVTPSRFSNYD